MCLTITNTSRQDTANLIKSLRISKKPLIAYKVLQIKHTKSIYNGKTVLTTIFSPYQEREFYFGTNKSNRSKGLFQKTKNERMVFNYEKEAKQISFGIHSILNLNDAINLKNELQTWCDLKYGYNQIIPKYAVFSVAINPDEIVLLGTFKYSNLSAALIDFSKEFKAIEYSIPSIVSTQVNLLNHNELSELSELSEINEIK